MLLSFVPYRHSFKSIHYNESEVEGFEKKRRQRSENSHFNAEAALITLRRGVHFNFFFPSKTKINSNCDTLILKRSSL